MRNLFPGQTESWLLERRNAINAALDGGSQTHVGIAPGIFHQFAKLTPEQLRARLDEYDYALYCLDSDRYENPYTTRTMKVKTVHR
jgi:hypothetical protein